MDRRGRRIRAPNERRWSAQAPLHAALSMLEIGDTYEVEKWPYSTAPAEFSREHNRRTGHILRSHTTSRGTLLVRIE